MAERSVERDSGYLATVSVEIYVPSQPEGERTVGDKLLTPDGAAIWDACVAREFIEGELNEKLADGGYPARLLSADLTRLRRLQLGGDIEPLDYRQHRVAEGQE